MSDQFELSFKNKEVRMSFIIMTPPTIAGLFILLFTDLQLISGFLPLIASGIFYIWRYFYRRKQKQETSIT